jgi:hypothetical protein
MTAYYTDMPLAIRFALQHCNFLQQIAIVASTHKPVLQQLAYLYVYSRQVAMLQGMLQLEKPFAGEIYNNSTLPIWEDVNVHGE